MFPSSFPSFGRLLGQFGQPFFRSEPGRSHGDGQRAESAPDAMHPCLALGLYQPPLPEEPVPTRVPLDAPDPASHVDAALTLLRRRTGVPLAERLATGLPSDRAAAIALLDALLTDGKPAGPLAASSPLAASEPGRRAIAQALALRDRLQSEPSADAATLQHAVDELVGTLEAIPYGREHSVLRERGDAALRAIVGGPPWDLAAMINSDRLPDRQAAARQIDMLLAHVRVLAGNSGQAPSADRFPPALRAALHRLVLEGGHGLNAAQRLALRQCPVLGQELEPMLQAGSTLSSVATDTLDRFCRHAGHCTADASQHAGDAVLLAELAALGASARKLADSARALIGDADRAGTGSDLPAADSAPESLLHDALATRLAALKPNDIANLHRWMTTPAMLALRAMVHRSARPGERHDTGTSRAASALAGQRRLLGDWLAAYDQLSALLTMRMAWQAAPAAKREAANKKTKPAAAPLPSASDAKARAAGKARASDQGPAHAGQADSTSSEAPHGASSASAQAGAVAAANVLFRQLFATDPAPETPAEMPLDWVRA
ncbi:hypothetical protein FX016_12300 [Cupriavidus gilardii]|nr:hypothetical protein FX016_12300 [Cupriavidus gilardii]